jgi:hypothetical protein
MIFWGSQNHFVEASTYFILALLIVGYFVGSFINTVIYTIELTIYSGSVMRYDPVLKDTVTTTSPVWNPTKWQSLAWNLYGFGRTYPIICAIRRRIPPNGKRYKF